MKALKIIGIIVLALVALWLIIGAIQPTQFTYERSLEMNAPKEVVFAQVNELKNWENWEPWSETDSSIKVTYEEQTAGVGGNYSWAGKQTGNGRITITESSVPTLLKTDIAFEGQDPSQGWFKLEDGSANNTKTSWGMSMKGPYPMNALMVFMPMEKMMNDMFDSGLAKLKTVSEQQTLTPAAPAFKVQNVDFPGKTYLAIRSKLKMDAKEMEKFYGENLGAIMGVVQSNKIQMDGMPTGIYYEWNEETKMTDMAAAIPVKDASKGRNGKNMQVVKLPAAKALLIDYYGGYSGLGGAHYAMDDYLNANGLKQKAPVLEEYITDPGQEPDSNKWLTKIYYFIEQ